MTDIFQKYIYLITCLSWLINFHTTMIYLEKFHSFTMLFYYCDHDTRVFMMPKSLLIYHIFFVFPPDRSKSENTVILSPFFLYSHVNLYSSLFFTLFISIPIQLNEAEIDKKQLSDNIKRFGRFVRIQMYHVKFQSSL